jgi:hypothetical protein
MGVFFPSLIDISTGDASKKQKSLQYEAPYEEKPSLHLRPLASSVING